MLCDSRDTCAIPVGVFGPQHAPLDARRAASLYFCSTVSLMPIVSSRCACPFQPPSANSTAFTDLANSFRKGSWRSGRQLPVTWLRLCRGFKAFNAFANALESTFEEPRLSLQRTKFVILTCRAEGPAGCSLPVSPAAAAATTPSEKAAAPIHRAGDGKAGTETSTASRPGTLSHRTCSISKWHFF